MSEQKITLQEILKDFDFEVDFSDKKLVVTNDCQCYAFPEKDVVLVAMPDRVYAIDIDHAFAIGGAFMGCATEVSAGFSFNDSLKYPVSTLIADLILKLMQIGDLCESYAKDIN